MSEESCLSERHFEIIQAMIAANDEEIGRQTEHHRRALDDVRRKRNQLTEDEFAIDRDQKNASERFMNRLREIQAQCSHRWVKGGIPYKRGKECEICRRCE